MPEMTMPEGLEVVLEAQRQQLEAVMGIAGILCGVLVGDGLVTREELADAFEARADSPIMQAFGRSVRVLFHGGRFDVIKGGKSD